MGTKVIAVGSMLMGDDYVGVRVLEILQEALENTGVTTIIGETDIDFCLSMIDTNDFLIIIDAASFGKKPGDITVTPIRSDAKSAQYSIHGLNIVGLLSLYNIDIHGFIIGIEVSEVLNGPGLSAKLNDKLSIIADEVFNIITSLIGQTA